MEGEVREWGAWCMRRRWRLQERSLFPDDIDAHLLFLYHLSRFHVSWPHIADFFFPTALWNRQLYKLCHKQHRIHQRRLRRRLTTISTSSILLPGVSMRLNKNAGGRRVRSKRTQNELDYQGSQLLDCLGRCFCLVHRDVLARPFFTCRRVPAWGPRQLKLIHPPIHPSIHPSIQLCLEEHRETTRVTRCSGNTVLC
ncbi:hypothetical protein GALMADRAFT_919767 [Galerina marginata CBS 339.88]|uniref:Uncharacterized protein n=1 Tax=Galerina marginata (strain CBS 339.88) TaxID=685588 RepID=A0A067SET4_GALM3|nr:hypothetical protein GALMADRAFT_919767 [Galerina marginata CBS 339.88]